MKSKLSVNHNQVEMNRFVEDLLAKVSVAIASALKGTEDMHHLDINLAKDDVRVTVNGREVPLNPFTSEVIGNTLRGLVSSLKGVGDATQVSISVETD